MQSYRLGEVFIAGGEPTVTYNPREDVALEAALEDYLDAPYRILSVTGPTKSGKTVLCRKVIPEQQRILISGGDISDEEDFWSQIIDELHAPTQFRETIGSSQDTSVRFTGQTKFSWLLPFSFGGSRERTRSDDSKTARTIVRNAKKAAIEGIQEENRILVVDDFHYIDKETQRRIILSLRTPIFEGLRVIFLAVPHRGFDVERAEPDMAGRVEQLEVPSWKNEELEHIAEEGFKALNIDPNSNMFSQFAKNSFGNPNLMQELCRKICSRKGIRKTSPTTVDIRMSRYESFFEEEAKPNYDLKKIISDFNSSRKERVTRKLEFEGREIDGDVYSVLFLSIRGILPNKDIRFEKIVDEVEGVCIDDAPKPHEISRALSRMHEIANKDPTRPHILEWDSEIKELHVMDAKFAFFLKWGDLDAIDLV
ncbi:MAG: hypothetical protein V3V97_05875 [Hyphomicrobiaceae bacterium]